MGLSTQASDWEFTGITQVSIAAGLGGGGYLFKFQSVTANVRNEDVFFIGVGLGVGAGVGQGMSAPDSSGRIPFSHIQCSNVFSLVDLDMSPGRLMNVGASAMVGYGAISVSAFNFSTGVLFDNAGGFGFSAGGLGAGANAFVGFWRVGRLGANAARRVSI